MITFQCKGRPFEAPYETLKSVRNIVKGFIDGVAEKEGIEAPDFLMLQDDLEGAVGDSVKEAMDDVGLDPSSRFDERGVPTGMVFLGNGRDSRYRCLMLHHKLGEALSILSCLQQGGCDGDDGCDETIEGCVRSIARALTGKEIEFVKE